MKLHKLVKYNGKRCLYNNWGRAVAITLLLVSMELLFLLLELIVSMILEVAPFVNVGGDGWYLNDLPNSSILSLCLSSILSIGSFLIITPLCLGIISWNYDMSEGKSPEVLRIFDYFSNRQYFKALTLKIHIWGRKLLWVLLFFALPGTIIGLSAWTLNFGERFFYDDINMSYILGSCGLVFGIALMLLMAVFYGIHMQKFFLAEYYLVSENCSAWSALKKSRHATKGKRGEIFLFRLSFLPWILSCLLVVPCMYVLPYYNISALIYARVLIEQHYRSTQLVPVTSSVPVETAENGDMDATITFDVKE